MKAEDLKGSQEQAEVFYADNQNCHHTCRFNAGLLQL